MKLFEIHVNGDVVWAMRDGEELASQRIGQDLDGPQVALEMATVQLVHKATSRLTPETLREALT